MITNEPILTSFLDEDFYKIGMGQLVFHDFPQAVVEYGFTNRGNTTFPNGFDENLRRQIDMMTGLQLTVEEADFLRKIPGIRASYVDFLRGYRFDPHEVEVNQRGGELFVNIYGPWYRTIFWEVRLLAIISELYYIMGGKTVDSVALDRLYKKGERLFANGCKWAEFGTRRRFSYAFQDTVVENMKYYEGFLGTSNVHLAMRHNVKPIGTSAHEMVMGLSALYGPKLANKMWMIHWASHFNGLNGIALPDTFTTKVFLRDFDSYFARLFDGLRQDSGDPYEWANTIYQHYNNLGIDPRTKTIIFSDGLTDESFIRLHRTFKDKFKVAAGIGTFLSNECGHPPLNIVIKMRTASFGKGPIQVVKLSDTPGKYTGGSAAILYTKQELGI